jgi:drug/metabolite transporter (DMT)-like permease
VTKKEKVGILITFLGMMTIIFQSFFEVGLKESATTIFGNILILSSNISFAASLIIAKKDLRRGVSAFSLMFYMFLVGLVTIIPLALKEVPIGNLFTNIFSLSWSAHLSVFYMAFASGALAYYLYQKAQKTIETSEAAIFLYLQPLVTAPLALFWLHERISTPYIIGSVIIAIGVILAEWKKRRYN